MRTVIDTRGPGARRHLARRLAAVATACVAVPVLAVIAAAPAHAGPSDVEGYVWGYQPVAASYIANSGYEYNSEGQPIAVTRVAAGDYLVRFRGMAAAGGVAHASAYGLTSNFCAVGGFAPDGSDLLVRVRCFNPAGNPADTMFVANYTNRQPAAGTLAYLWSDDPVPPPAHVPASWFDTTGQKPLITRIAAGRYQVRLGALDATFPVGYLQGHLRATAYGKSATRCEVLDPRLQAPLAVPVRCYDPAGAAVDSRFTLTLAHQVNLLGATPPYAAALLHPQPVGDPVLGGWTNPGGAPSATKLGVGRYLVSFPGLAMPFGHAIANAFGTPPMYCHVAGWWPNGVDQVVRVDCRQPNGALTDVWAFQLSITR